MRGPRAFILFWTVVIAALLFIEVAELTHLFTIPFLAAVSDPVTFALALIFVTIVALVGAIFIGIYVSQRLLSPRGFSPFEEEMLKMRAEVMEIRRETQEMLERLGVPDGKTPSPARAPTDPGDSSEDRR
jgi:membrane protein implicated in regulation of membrane protease activity